MLLSINLLSCTPTPTIVGGPDVNDVITPAAVIDVVYIRSFALEQGYSFDWRQERPFIRSGTLAVFKVDPDLVRPRSAAEPVLYVGNQTAQRLNHGHESGFVIAIIPGEVDLARQPVWFGRPDLPERVNAGTIRTERARSEKAGIRLFEAEKIRNLTREPLEASDLPALLREHVADLLIEYSPQEKALAETWRLPVAQR